MIKTQIKAILLLIVLMAAASFLMGMSALAGEPLRVTVGVSGRTLSHNDVIASLVKAGINKYDDSYIVTITPGVTAIDDGAFFDCQGAVEVTIPEGVASIGNSAFTACYSLTTIRIPASVTVIHPGAFPLTHLSSFAVAVENSHYATIDGVLFNKNITTLISYPKARVGHYTIPDGVKSIGTIAFESCQNLSGITIPKSVTVIGENAFNWCSFTELILPEDLAIIGNGAFWGCEGLQSIRIPAKVTEIGSSVFSYCEGLAKIEVDPLNPAYSSVDGVLFNKDRSVLVTYPFNRQGPYDLPEGLLQIDSTAFVGCLGLTKITLSSTIIDIAAQDFFECPSLSAIEVVVANPVYSSANGVLFNKEKSILIRYPEAKEGFYTIPASVKQINDNAFIRCQRLSGVNIPISVSEIGENAFSACPGLVSMEIPKSITNLARGIFGGCDNLEEVILPEDLIEIGSYAFASCYKLADITIPPKVEIIGDNAFHNCPILTDITIPASVKAIGNWVFSWCSALTNINVDPKNSVYQSINGVLFEKDPRRLIIYPHGKVGPYTIPEGTVAIGNYAFQNCRNLTGVTFPFSLTEIGAFAFEFCSELNNMIIPANVRRINDSAFRACDSLKNMTFLSFYPPGFGDIVFDLCGPITVNVTPKGLAAYQAQADAFPLYSTINATVPDEDGDEGGMNITVGRAGEVLIREEVRDALTQAGLNPEAGRYIVTIAPGVTAIGYQAFSGCYGMREIIIPEGVITIGRAAFQGCHGLTEINLPSGLIEIKEGAFAFCAYLANVLIPEGVTAIEDSAFTYCSSLTEIFIPKSVTGIGNSVFFVCSRLQAIAVDEDNPNYSSLDGVLFNKNQTVLLEHPPGRERPVYTVPGGVLEIGRSAFAGNYNNLTEVILPAGLQAIGYAAFDSCESLKHINIPASVREIGVFAFARCRSLTDIYIPANTTQIGCPVFLYCTSLLSIEVAAENSAYSSLGGVLFDKNKTVLISYPGGKTGAYVIPAGVIELAYSAFAGCIELTKVTMPAGLREINPSVFAECLKLTDISIPASVLVIGHGAFETCLSLKEITIPASVTVIGDYAFRRCESLRSITFQGVDPPQLGEFLFHECEDPITVYVPSQGLTAYKALVALFPAGSTIVTRDPPPTNDNGNPSGISTSSPATYTVTFESNGGSAVAKQTAEGGGKAAKPTDPTKGGYIFGSWYIDKELTQTYDFNMAVSKNITLYAKWTELVEITTPIWSNPFADVKSSNWFYDDVEFVVQNGLFNGTSDTTFNPQGTMTRAMLFTVLARLAGVGTEGGETWYSLALDWAVKEGLTDGSNPQNPVTREQIVTILWRYAGRPPGTGSLADFSDSQAVSNWAIDAFKWATQVGVINGKDSKLVPQGQATRAEVAAILHRYIALEK